MVTGGWGHELEREEQRMQDVMSRAAACGRLDSSAGVHEQRVRVEWACKKAI
jgi:hypothetical protein